MTKSTRREALAYLGAAAVFPWPSREAGGEAFSAQRGRQSEPQLILYNGNFITVDAKQPRAQAVAIGEGKFLAVGKNDDVRHLAAARTRQVDLGGRTVTPGFIDAHTHPAISGRLHLRQVDCDLRSIAAIQAALRERAGKTKPGDWVLGFKYDDTKTAEGRPLSRADLDAVSATHPVFVSHRGGHTGYANSQAFAKAGITDQTPDPPGGKIDRDAQGRLAGRVRETATDALERVIPANYTPEEYREGVQLISKMMTRAGVTSAHDAFGSPADLRAYRDARAAGQLRLRLYCLIGYAGVPRVEEAGEKTGAGDEWVRVGAVKLVCDGSISERTARLSQPYIGRPDDYGLLVTEERELYERARQVHSRGWQIGIHANGDTAIDIVLRIYERLQKEQPRPDPRFRLEHCTMVNPALVARIKALGAIPNPFSTYVYYHGEKMREYGAERLEWMFAVRSFLDAGIRVTQTSDYPPGPFEPMMALQSQVTRTDSKGHVWGGRQRVSVEEAIRVGTLHGAYASFEETVKGSIEAGKYADLVVLGRDPLREPPQSLISIPIERTMVGGRWVFEA
jgi:hypothetical protein